MPPRVALVGATVALIYVLGAALALRQGAHGVSVFIDDAYYYLIIARNFAQSGFPTFDGLHGTNGFHPLWMLLLAAMYSVIGAGAALDTQILGARALETLVLGLALAACVFAFARLRDRTPLAWGFAGAALVLLAPRFLLFEQGMESTLAAALLVVAIYALLDRRERLFAATLPLLFLARLDSLVFVIPPLVAAWGLASPGWKREWKVIVPTVVVAAAYMGLNLVLTGSATPISGQIKSSFPRVSAHFEFLWDPLRAAASDGWMPLVTAPNLFAVAAATALLAIALFALRRQPGSRPLAWMLLASALLVANLVFFQRWSKGVDPRYLALPYVLLGFVAFAFLAGASRSARAPAVAFAVLAVAWAASDVSRLRSEWNLRHERAGRHEVMAKTRPGERFAGTDVGGFAFWLERPFVNLDGLVNNRDLQDAIRDKRLARYLEDSDVRYLKVAFWDAPQGLTNRPTERMYLSRIFAPGVAGRGYKHYDFILYSYVHDSDSEPIRLCPAQEIFREHIGRDGTANAAIVIYRLSRPIATDRGQTTCSD